MASLYEIDSAIMDCVDSDTGEIIDEEKLNALLIPLNMTPADIIKADFPVLCASDND